MEKRRRRIPLKQSPEFTGKQDEKRDPMSDRSKENKADELPEPGELTQTKEDPKSGNIGKDNAGGNT